MAADRTSPTTPCLADGVVGLSGERLQTRDRADRDQRSAATLLEQRGRAGLERAPHAGEVDVDHGLPLVLGHLPELRPRRDARVGDDDVEPAELVDAGADDLVERCLVAHVGRAGDDAPAEVLHRGRGLVEVGQIGGDDVGAGGRERRGRSPAPDPGPRPVTNATRPSRSIPCTLVLLGRPISMMIVRHRRMTCTGTRGSRCATTWSRRPSTR